MTKPVSVEIYMTSHRVLGRVDPGTTGLFSFFNLPTSSVIEVEGAHLNRLHQPGRLVSRHTEMWLIKREIVTVLLSSRAELGPMSMVGSEVRIPVAAATGDCKGVHLRVQLWQNGFSVDGMFLRYDGIRGIYIRYVDADGSGTLSQGDVIRVVDSPAGSLEVHLFFRGTELASVAWTSP